MRRFYILLLVLFLPVMLHSQSHVLRQLVSNWVPDYDETGVKWVVYDVTDPTMDVLTESSIGSYTIYSAGLNAIRWNCNIGNFSTPWSNGDRLMALGSWEMLSGTVYHKGYYWVFNDTVDATQDPQTWDPSDTLREIPIPWVSLSGDTITVKWLKPLETGGSYPDTLNIMGFLVYVDTTGTGLSSNFHQAVYVSNTPGVSHPGSPQDTIEYIDYLSNYPSTISGLYYAIKLVARPDTGSGFGYTTYYLSGNSDFVPVSGHPLKGEIHSWPGIDTAGVFWGLFKVTSPVVDFLTKGSGGSYEFFDTTGIFEWYQDALNFSGGWSSGDEVIGFVDYDTASGSFNHTGFYAVINDTLDTVRYPVLFPDTMRPIPTPMITAEYGQSGDTVFVDSVDTELKWVRANESAGNPPMTNITGYMVYVDETGTGLPSNFNLVGYAPYTGSDTITFIDPNSYAVGQVLYYGLRLVYRPDIFHISLYLSGNSSPVKIVPAQGCKEGTEVKHKFSFRVYPEITNRFINISLELPKREKIGFDLVGVDGRIVKHLYRGNLNKGHHSFRYAPCIRNGIYFLIMKRGEEVLKTKKLIFMK